MTSCAMTLLASPADVNTIRPVARHLRKTANYDFSDVVLVLDTLAPHPAEKTEPLMRAAAEMLADGEITRIVKLSDQRPCRRWFLEIPWRLRDHRGIPILGWIAGIDATDCDYVCHFDSDILMRTERNFSWVEKAIECLKADPHALYVAPHPGPPTPDGSLRTEDWSPSTGQDGHWRFKEFVSRRFVIERQRLAALLPLQPRHISWKRRLAMYAGGKSALLTWEEHMTHAVRASPYWGVWLSDSRAWSLHCPDHGRTWQTNIADLIDAVEAGRFPEEQAGHYDLQLDNWLTFFDSNRSAPR